jgi:hypothetical protein
MKEKRFKTRSEAGTLAMGERVTEMLLPAPKLIVLRGDLGMSMSAKRCGFFIWTFTGLRLRGSF